ncbi:MAG TPA: hypothetical protein VHA35_19155 [Dongiaceae bacterium]|jgi:hypothetical protein|nr:hypothetical protein [Dongiaceae bacterium]
MAWSWRQTLKSLLQKAESPRTAGIRLARTIDWSGAQPGRDTVLCLDRSQFIKDIEELRRFTALNWVTLNAVRLKTRQEAWVPPQDREQGYLSTWLKEERAQALRPILAEFGTALLEEAGRTARIDAVATANIDYWQDETIKLGCNALGIPFLVLCRENYTIPWTVPWMHDHLAKARFRFEGAGLAVFSEATKGAFAPGFDDPNDIWVTGAPRYDRWLDLKPLPESAKNHLSLITFNDPGYMAENVFVEVAGVFDRVARAERAAGRVWMVKCKKKGDRDEILERLGTRGDSPLTFEYDVPLFELYPRSRVVVGYNSLALVEAMLTDAPVVVPCWGETRAPRKDLLIDYDDALVQSVVTFARSPAELADLLQQAARGAPLKSGTPEQRRALFAAHLHVPEAGGSASAAVERFVRHYIARARSAPRQAA